jgi:hypothetical protein
MAMPWSRRTASSFATPAPPGTALALRARASVRRTAGAVQVSTPLGTRPAFFAGSCPASRALHHPLYGNAAGSTSPKFPHASRVGFSEVVGPPLPSR